MSINVEINQRFDDLPEIGHDAMARCMDLVAQELWGQVRIEAPVDTGRLAGSFLLERRDPLTHAVFTNVLYALAVHEGSGPRVIEPRNAAALYWPGARHPVARVNHPGTPSNKYAERAFENTERRINDFAELAITQAMEAAGL